MRLPQVQRISFKIYFFPQNYNKQINGKKNEK